MSHRPTRTSQGRTARATLLGLGAFAILATAVASGAPSWKRPSRHSVPAAPAKRTITPSAFAIRGHLSATLAPGRMTPVNLRLTNPNHFALSVTRLTVRIRSVISPRADASHPCTRRDFVTRRFSSARGLRLRPARSRTLRRLGLPRRRWPRVGMLDRPVNQDGCKGASLRLAYRGVARRSGS